MNEELPKDLTMTKEEPERHWAEEKEERAWVPWSFWDSLITSVLFKKKKLKNDNTDQSHS